MPKNAESDIEVGRRGKLLGMSLSAIRARAQKNLHDISWQRWLAEVVGAGALGVAVAEAAGPWVGFLITIVSIVGILALITASEIFAAKPGNIALLGAAFCGILAAGVGLSYRAGEVSVRTTASTAPTSNVQFIPDTNAGLLSRETCESDGTDAPGLLVVSVRQTGPDLHDKPVSVIQVAQEDPDSCEVVLSETAASDGQQIRLFNMSAQPLVIKDLPGIHDLAGDFTMGQNDHIALRYNKDRWVELSRQDN